MSEWTKKGPLEWQEYTYKEVRVTACEKEFRGWVLTTDPVSANIVLVNFLDDGSLSVTGIMGQTVQSVETLGEGDWRTRERLTHLFSSGHCEGYSLEDLEERKNSLKKWLEKNHIPVSELGDSPRTLCVAGVLTIDPPYSPENCSSANEIILSRVQELIQGQLPASQSEARN
ncbi:gem-associated protein 6 [Erinaceus europaeus]|uniref:Gem-associated protein 6 n=1 Tax=Erinaceus europaeus TaxID=9365 RepID=A0A1S2ZL65_ERIEU|nr:gem-associated protein 6 [Erinaceus europaeus]XP_060042866.1 gem-associated protein 6 [Erinaceus europaeus]XP_060042867.1 gem-associated protein 6 [Erinaceus europaeus]XP_060042868.1 gem-associated protein 6 [Erinaceus europaeus]XP_060042869.1 gem-associated protein 6 [Erinaceus europaeus]